MFIFSGGGGVFGVVFFCGVGGVVGASGGVYGTRRSGRINVELCIVYLFVNFFVCVLYECNRINQ